MQITKTETFMAQFVTIKYNNDEEEDVYIRLPNNDGWILCSWGNTSQQYRPTDSVLEKLYVDLLKR